jgi:hypothetical protein
VQRRVDQVRRRGDRVVFVFYYSGHAANGVLHLGETERIGMGRVKELLEQTDADVRLAFIDSCGAGAITRQKGASLAPPFLVKVDNDLTARGQVIIASSSADEASQESDEIQGSFFTHYLTTGMRGDADENKDGKVTLDEASQESDEIQGSFFTHYLTTGMRGDADENKDGKVTLDEAYSYAYGRTVAATSATRTGAQHPTYAYDIQGAGEVVLTQPGNADVVITFPGELEGRYFVVDLERQIFVAEIDKAAGAASRIALPRGQYAIKKRLDTHLLMKRVDARNKGVVVVDESQMEQVSFDEDYAKGSPILIAEEDGVTWSLSLGAGGQLVLEDPTAGSLFPPLGFVSLEGRVKNLIGEHLINSVDVAFGTRAHTVRPVGVEIPTQYSQAQLGTSLMYELPLFWGLSAAGGGRLAALFLTSQYQDTTGGMEFYTVVVPGLQGLVAWQPVDWFHVEALARANYLVYTIDGRNLGYVEGLVSAWVDF